MRQMDTAAQRIRAIALTAVLATSAIVVPATIGPAESASAASYSATCWKPNPKIRGSVTTNWNGKNPKKCKARYTVYDTSRGRAALVIDIGAKAAKSSEVWAAIGRGYKAANKWCATNTIVCNVILAVGVAIVSPLLASNS